MVTFALTWLSVALGLVSKSVETASNLPMPLMLLPFLGSGFVPTDSMPAGLRWFAEHQPFTPDHRDAARPADGHPDRQQRAASRVAWCAVIALGGYLWVEEAVQPRPDAVTAGQSRAARRERGAANARIASAIIRRGEAREYRKAEEDHRRLRAHVPDLVEV